MTMAPPPPPRSATRAERGTPAPPLDLRALREAPPRELLGKMNTDAIGAAAQRAQITRLEEQLSDVRAPALKALRSELSREEIGALDAALSGKLDARGVEPALSPKRSLEHLINDAHYHELSPSERARLLRPIAAAPEDVASIKSAIALLKTGALRRLRADEREKLFTVFSMLGPESRALLARLAARPLRGRTAIEDRDLREVGLIENLHDLACGAEIAAELEVAGYRRSRLLSLVLGSVAHPVRLPLEEGPDGVLGTLEFTLADVAPAEFVRLWLELSSSRMRFDLAGGGVLDLRAAGGARGRLDLSGRVSPLRLGLAQLAGASRPSAEGGAGAARASRSPTGDEPTFMLAGGQSIDASALAQALTAIFGHPFTVGAGAQGAFRQLSRVDPDPSRCPPAFLTTLYDRGERLFTFDRFAEDAVFIRAPHGRSTKRRGTERPDPSRIVEDPDIGLERIARADFESACGFAVVPRRATT